MTTQDKIREVYKAGFIDGLTCYAWWHSGEQEVGASGTKLKDAIAKVEKSWNYNHALTKIIEEEKE